MVSAKHFNSLSFTECEYEEIDDSNNDRKRILFILNNINLHEIYNHIGFRKAFKRQQKPTKKPKVIESHQIKFLDK